MIQAQLDEEHLQLCALFDFEGHVSLCADSLGCVLQLLLECCPKPVPVGKKGSVNVLSLLWPFVFIIFLFPSPPLTTFMWCFTTGNNKAFAQ